MIAPHTSDLITVGIGAVAFTAAVIVLIGELVSPRFRRFLDRQEARGERRRRGE